MLSVFQVVIAAIESAGEALGRRKPANPEDKERRDVQQRNERATILFIIFVLVFCSVLLAVMAFH